MKLKSSVRHIYNILWPWSLVGRGICTEIPSRAADSSEVLGSVAIPEERIQVCYGILQYILNNTVSRFDLVLANEYIWQDKCECLTNMK